MIEELLEDRYPKPLTLRDGTVVTVRPLVRSDEPRLLEFFQDIPNEDRIFLKDNVTDPATVANWCRNVNYDLVLPLIAELDGRIVADASLHHQPRGWMSHVGRVRISIHKTIRGKGLATLLLRELIVISANCGLEKLDAEFMAPQVAAMAPFEHVGFKRAAVLPQHVRDLKGRNHDFVLLVYDLQPPVESLTPL
jgi:L-amino acid N-acyltransferase YncA